MKLGINFLGEYIEQTYGVTDFIYKNARYVKTVAGIWVKF